MAQHIDQYRIETLCEGLQVSRSGFYRWRSRKQVVCAVDGAVEKAFKTHKGRAGAPCLTADVQADGMNVSERTVGRSLSKQGLHCRHKRKFRHTTDSNHRLPIAPNLLNRNFTVNKPNVAWVGDITYLQTSEGWLYLATMIDLFNRQVIGWQVSTRIDQVLVNDALNVALITRGKPRGVIIHTDRGVQYVSIRYADRLAEAGISPSVGSRGDSYDNALSETINGLYKSEVIHHRGPRKTKASVELATLEWVSWFNNQRLLESIGDIPPAEAEAWYYQQLAATAAEPVLL